MLWGRGVHLQGLGWPVEVLTALLCVSAAHCPVRMEVGSRESDDNIPETLPLGELQSIRNSQNHEAQTPTLLSEFLHESNMIFLDLRSKRSTASL